MRGQVAHFLRRLEKIFHPGKKILKVEGHSLRRTRGKYYSLLREIQFALMKLCFVPAKFFVTIARNEIQATRVLRWFHV